jgi:hypothetical protein
MNFKLLALDILGRRFDHLPQNNCFYVLQIVDVLLEFNVRKL